MKLAVVPFPQVGDGFSAHEGERVVVADYSVPPKVIERFALDQGVVGQDGSYYLVYDRVFGETQAEFIGYRPHVPPLLVILRGIHLVSNKSYEGDERRAA